MKLYQITNGWHGCSYVRVLCIAESEDDALKQATPKFKNAGKNHPKRYWEELKVEVLCDNVFNPWCGEVSDE